MPFAILLQFWRFDKNTQGFKVFLSWYNLQLYHIPKPGMAMCTIAPSFCAPSSVSMYFWLQLLIAVGTWCSSTGSTHGAGIKILIMILSFKKMENIWHVLLCFGIEMLHIMEWTTSRRIIDCGCKLSNFWWCTLCFDYCAGQSWNLALQGNLGLSVLYWYVWNLLLAWTQITILWMGIMNIRWKKNKRVRKRMVRIRIQEFLRHSLGSWEDDYQLQWWRIGWRAKQKGTHCCWKYHTCFLRSIDASCCCV